MRRLLSLSLLSLLLLNVLGGLSLLLLHRLEMREFIEHLVSTGESEEMLTQLTFCESELDQLNWFVENREFRYNGHQYDVVQSENLEDGSIILHCYRDDKENNIFQNLFKELEFPTEQSADDCALVFQIYKLLSEILITPPHDHHMVIQENARVEYLGMHVFRPVYLTVTCEPPDAGSTTA